MLILKEGFAVLVALDKLLAAIIGFVGKLSEVDSLIRLAVIVPSALPAVNVKFDAATSAASAILYPVR